MGDAAGAAQELRRALELRPGDAEALLRLAGLTRDRPEAALSYAQLAAGAAAPARRRAAAHRLAGEIQSNLGDKAAAEASLTRALELAGEDLDSLRALAALKRDEPAAAAAYARRAARAAASAPAWCRGSAHRLAAQIFNDVKDHARAATELARALAIDPEDFEALQALARIEHRWPEVTVDLHAGEEANAASSPPAGGPEDLETLRAAGDASGFSAAIASAPPWQRSDAYRLSVEMWLDRGDAAKAGATLKRLDNSNSLKLATYRLYHRVYPESPRGPAEAAWLSQIVRLRLECGDPEGARAALQRGLARSPDDLALLELGTDFEMAHGTPERARVLGKRLLAGYESASPSDLFKVFPDDTFYPGLPLVEEDKRKLALKDAAFLAGLGKEREDGRRRALEKLARIGLLLKPDKAGRR